MNLNELERRKAKLLAELHDIEQTINKHKKRFCPICNDRGEDFMGYKCPYADEPWHYKLV